MPQRSRSFLLFLVLFLFLSACQAAQQEEETPTPFTDGFAPTIAPPPAAPTPVTIRELVLRPADYENSYVRVSGTYLPLPPLACGDAPRVSPATWSLVGEELFLQAAGYDTVLNAVAPNGLAMTVDGQWRRWRGQVGCGKEAAETEIYYLDVIVIVSPNPLAYQPQEVSAVNTVPVIIPTELGPPLTPPGEEQTPIVGEVTPGPTIALATPTFPSQPSPTIGGSNPTATFALPPTATTTGGGAATPTATRPTTATAGATAATGTPGGTPGTTGTPGTATSTTTAGTPAGTTVPPGNTVDQGPLNFDDVEKVELAASTADLWTFEASAGTIITLSTIAPTDFNMVLTLIDPSGNTLINNQNNSPADQAETITRFSLPVVGTYEVIVTEATGKATPYALTLYAFDALSPLFPGNLKYGSDITTILPENADHYWHFLGNAGDIITIRVILSDQTDIFFALYGPNGEELVSVVDEFELGGTEELINYTLPVGGYITLYIAENFFATSHYRVTLTKQ